jgi:hypothetical protein
MKKGQSLEQVTRYADMLSAMGTEPRLRIMQLLLSAHPDGLVVVRSAMSWESRARPFPTTLKS